jgi:hypothetical protein
MKQRLPVVVMGTVVVLMMSVLVVQAGPLPVPAQISGTVTVDGVLLTKAMASGYRFTVTSESGADYIDAAGKTAEDSDGLSDSNNYVIKIPLYESQSQPQGAHSGDTGVIHVYKDTPGRLTDFGQ